MLICGLDEAGRGPLAGPVVTAAVILDDINRINGVRDSKKLTALQREALYNQIVENSLWWDVQVIDAHIIDSTNITYATMLGFQRSLQKLKIEDVEILVDGNYFRLPDMKNLKFSYRTIIGGDNIIYQISAASILAKVTRDRLMKLYHSRYPIYNFHKNKGYPTKQHIQVIKQFGLSEIHRKTFCTKYINSPVIL